MVATPHLKISLFSFSGSILKMNLDKQNLHPTQLQNVPFQIQWKRNKEIHQSSSLESLHSWKIGMRLTCQCFQSKTHVSIA